jgi:hypothetical protein
MRSEVSLILEPRYFYGLSAASHVSSILDPTISGDLESFSNMLKILESGDAGISQYEAASSLSLY